jgi:hypothetical protein
VRYRQPGGGQRQYFVKQPRREGDELTGDFNPADGHELPICRFELNKRCQLFVRSEIEPLNQAPIITVIGKAFWDIGHPSKD